MSELVTVPTDAGDMPAHLWLPESGGGPGIVLLQEIFGVSDYVQRRGEELAGLGYVVLAPEIYWRLGATEPVEGADALERGMALVQQLDWSAAVTDGAAAVRALRQRPEVRGGVGIVGFCFGGGLGYNVAAHLEDGSVDGEPVDALVSYYGSALPGLVDTVEVKAPSLHHFGLADSFIDTETVRRIEAAVTAKAATTFHTYDGADHAFDNPDLQWHHPEASAEAWERTVAFLGEHLPLIGQKPA